MHQSVVKKFPKKHIKLNFGTVKGKRIQGKKQMKHIWSAQTPKIKT